MDCYFRIYKCNRVDINSQNKLKDLLMLYREITIYVFSLLINRNVHVKKREERILLTRNTPLAIQGQKYGHYLPLRKNLHDAKAK